MESKDQNSDKDQTLEIKSYIPTKEFDSENHAKFNELLYKHPRDRQYLTHKEYIKEFAADAIKAKELIDYAKSQNWEVTHNKKSREVSIKISSSSSSDKSDNRPSIEKLRFFNQQGDINLKVESEAVDNNSESDSVLKNGFVKGNQEKRVGRGEAIPLQNESHGHSVLEVSEAYNFPEGDGEGQTIGIIELGGKFEQSDMETFFLKYGLEVPKIQVVGTPSTTPIKDNVEVTADIQVAGVLAPKAKLVMYYGTTILSAMKTVLADGRNKLTVISISWAGSEMDYSQAELNELNNVFHEAALKGITVVVASGDNGAFNNLTYPNVNVPSVSPFVLGCGGTKMEMFNDKIAAEVVWNESKKNIQIGTGGGFSRRVNQPPYQEAASKSYLSRFPQYAPYDRQRGRSIPDVAANAADASGYSICFEGQWMKIGGTSLATPLWAALIARMNQNLGYQLGFITSRLYKLIGTEAFHPIVEGNNNLYVGAVDWNPCTGLGTPNGEVLQHEIQSMK